VRDLGFDEATATAVRQLDEHWNGAGHPRGLKGEEISLPARIACLAQTVEVFFTKFEPTAALEMVAARSGRWFDPNLAATFQAVAAETPLWQELREPDAAATAARFEPEDRRMQADEATLDRTARAFARVVDAKSPWTFRHSQHVAEIADGMAEQLEFEPSRLRRFRRTALLHDVGKLGVSNMVLDKPGKLTDDEFAAMKQHAALSEQILSGVSAFSDQAMIAGAHHERYDARGYFRGVASSGLPIEARILMVADVFEALTAARPYRDAMPTERVIDMLRTDAGRQGCPVAVEALECWLEGAGTRSRVEAQMEELNRLFAELSSTDCPTC